MRRALRLSLSAVGCLGSLLAGAHAVRAQPVPKFEYSAPDEKDKELEEPTWTLTAQASAIVTSGNSRATTVSAGAAAMRKTGMNKFSVDASLAYARSSVLTFAFTALYDSEPAPRPKLAGVMYNPDFVQPQADSLDTITELQLIVSIL